MKKEDYLIDYTITFNSGATQEKRMRVKNCTSTLHAKLKFGDYLKAKHGDMKSFSIDNCKVDTLGFFENMGFGDIFNTK